MYICILTKLPGEHIPPPSACSTTHNIVGARVRGLLLLHKLLERERIVLWCAQKYKIKSDIIHSIIASSKNIIYPVLMEGFV